MNRARLNQYLCHIYNKLRLAKKKKNRATILYRKDIPHTLKNTTLGKKSKSDTLNIETDIIGKYVTNLLSFEDEDSDLDVGMLKAIRHLQYGES